MALTQIIAIGIATAVAVLILRPLKSELAVVVGLVGSAIMLVLIIGGLADIVSSINGLVARTGLATQLFASILKIVGIGYLCDIAASICRDAGSQTVADMIVLGGKVTIVILAMPIIQSLVDVVLGVLN